LLRAIALLTAVTITLGCIDRDAVLARRLETASPVVERVEYTPEKMIDPPRIDIFLRAGTPKEEGLAAACNVLLQITKLAVKDHELEVFVWTSDHDLVAASDTPCAQ
jgi:hypothetical protein